MDFLLWILPRLCFILPGWDRMGLDQKVFNFYTAQRGAHGLARSPGFVRVCRAGGQKSPELCKGEFSPRHNEGKDKTHNFPR